MRRILAALLLATVFTAACSDQQQIPTEPALPSSDLVVPGCPTPLQISQQITKLFPLGNGLIISQATWVVIVLKVNAGRTADAQKLTRDLIAFTLSQFNAGKLRPTATLDMVTKFISDLDCFVGLAQPVPPGAKDVVVAVVSPLPPDQTTILRTPGTLDIPPAQAAIQIPGNAVTVPTLITIFAKTDGVLLTDLTQSTVHYQFTSSGGPFNNDVLVGLCHDLPDASQSFLRVAHNVPEPIPNGIEILPLALSTPSPENWVQCAGGEGFLAPSSSNLAVRGLQQLGRDIFHLVSPAPLSATATVGGTGVAGKTKKLSTFGVVDTRTIQFQASGYRYSFTAPIPGWEATTFDDSSSPWLDGQAAFGNTSTACTALSLSILTNTWLGAPTRPNIFIRRHFKAELGTTSVSIQVAIDNDTKVFVNGTDITSSADTARDVDGFVEHENCATLNNPKYVFTAPVGILNLGGDNVIAIQGRDRGVMSYLDQQTTLVVPTEEVVIP